MLAQSLEDQVPFIAISPSLFEPPNMSCTLFYSFLKSCLASNVVSRLLPMYFPLLQAAS